MRTQPATQQVPVGRHETRDRLVGYDHGPFSIYRIDNMQFQAHKLSNHFTPMLLHVRLGFGENRNVSDISE